MAPVSDTDLAAQLRTGDPGAVERWLDAYWTRAYRLAVQIVGDTAGAEDAAQEAFVLGLSKLDTLHDSAAFRPWFLRIVRTTALKHVRTQSRRAARERSPDNAADLAPSVAEHLEREEEHAQVRAHLAQLSPKLRCAVALRYLEDLTLAEMAEVLDVPRKTVSSRIRRGLDELKRSLQPSGALCVLPAPSLLQAALGLPAPPPPQPSTLGDAARLASVASPTLTPVASTVLKRLALLPLALLPALLMAYVLGAFEQRAPRAPQPSTSAPRPAALAAVESNATRVTVDPAPGPTHDPRVVPKSGEPRVPGEEEPSMPATPQVTGRVVDASGAGVPNAWVHFPTQGKWSEVQTDADGRFSKSLHYLQPRDFQQPFPFVAERQGYFVGKAQISLDPLPLAPVEIRLEQGTPISVQVLDLQGEPVARAKVTVSTLIHRNERQHLEATANGLGIANFKRVDSTRPRIFVHAEGFAKTALDVDCANPSEVHRIVLLPAARVTGRLVDATSGAPIAGARAHLVPLTKNPKSSGRNLLRPTATTDATGAFEFPGMLPGTYELQAEASARTPLRRRVSVGSKPRLDLGDLTLRGATSLEVRVVDPQGAPIARMVVDVIAVSNPEVRAPQGTTDTDGRVRLQDNVPAGRMLVRAWETFGRWADAFSLVDLSDGGPQTLTIQLTRGGKLVGRTHDSNGAPVPRARFVLQRRDLWEAGYTPANWLRARSDEQGERALDLLAPGHYRLAHREDTESGSDWVEVREGEVASCDLQLAKHASISGTLLEATGEPLANAQVEFGLDQHYNGSRLFTPSRTTRTDERGRFAFAGVEQGPYVVRFSSTQGKATYYAFTHAHDAHSSCDVRLPFATSVAGLDLEVLAGDRVPASAAHVSLVPVGGGLVPETAEARCTTAGEAAWKALAPGRYLLRAKLPGLATGRAVVEVAPGTTTQARIVLVEGAAVQLPLRPQNGRADVECQIVARPRIDPADVTLHNRRANELVTLEGLAPGVPYDLTVKAPGYTTQHLEVTPKQGGTTLPPLELVPR